MAGPQATLPGSVFEIDDDANLKNDAAFSGSVDWADLDHPNGPEIRATDLATGQNDDSYKGGVKEDTECPAETTGSIPNNKSDLLTFHVYKEAGTGGHPGFLDLAWSRVSDPSGTTLMDFEFNQSKTACAQGPNVVRTAGDLLIEYAIDQGGARANISARTWTGSAWGPSEDVDADSPLCPKPDNSPGPCAVGTINNLSTIPAAEADGLGEKQLRTFGEAQIDLRYIFKANKCVSLGTAMLKSRSSDSFTSQLKDFIRPKSIDLTNCGKVIIRKQTLPDENPNTTQFTYTKVFDSDPSSADRNTFKLTDDGVETFSNVLFGSGLTVEESTPPTGWSFKSLDCSASTNVPAGDRVVAGAKVTFTIDSADDILDCTYTNEALGTVIVKKVINDGLAYVPTNGFGFTTSTLTGGAFDLKPTGTGSAGSASKKFENLSTGTTYDVAETVPSGWNLVSATCDDTDSTPASIKLSAGETVTCTFVNEVERGAILIEKDRKHAALGSGNHPHAGVTFEVSGGDLSAPVTTSGTNSSGYACLGNLVVSSLAGNYSVKENVPIGYVAKSTNPQTGIVVAESTCAGKQAAEDATGDKEDAYFLNMPLTDIKVLVNSQIDGGTASTIECNPALPNPDATTGADGDGSYEWKDLEPGNYTCTVVIDP